MEKPKRCEVSYYEWAKRHDPKHAAALIRAANCDLRCSLASDHDGPHKWLPGHVKEHK